MTTMQQLEEAICLFFFKQTLVGTPGVLDISLELAPYCKAGSNWLREVSQTVIGGHWRSLIRLIRLIRLIGLDLQWKIRLHSYMWMDGLDGMDGIGYHRS